MPMTGRCKALNCHAMVIRPDRYCSKHHSMEQAEKEKRKEYDRVRYQNYNYKRNNMNRMKSEQNKFYHTKQWRSIREIALRRDNYLCQYCLNHKRIRTGNIGDHIVPYEVEPENRANLANIAIACSKCHTAKTKWEQLYYGTGAGNTLKRVIPIRNVKDLPDFQKK
ncbi:HNH endonuclease [Lactococcus lactis]|uniref:HNH endonuclease n=1 Tax=Lactococcus lactis TaxID=1358 RepID=UPI0022E75677|nr:HNH endonuclease [Lactococcus lactis]